MADVTLEPAGSVDLTNCDREPIHIPGSVQPHATVFVLEEPGLVIRQASTNAATRLGIALEDLLGRRIAEFLSPSDVAILEAALLKGNLDAKPHYLPPIRLGLLPESFEPSLHRYKGALILELEQWDDTASVADSELLAALKEMLTLSNAAESVAEFCQRTAEDVRRFIGFDRVMVYRFDADLSGNVIAEAKREDLETYLGLHYPASDIPKQARELFRLSRLRLIPDLKYAPVPISPTLRNDTGQPLDMSFCVTRSVSPVHVEYLQNMGVRASLSISVVIDRQLWGLFSCHHYAPRYVPHAGRIACDFLAHALAVLVAGREQSEDFAYTKSLHENQRLLTQAIQTKRDFGQAVKSLAGSSIGGIAAEGAALVAHGVVYLKGVTPSETQVLALAQFFAASEQEEVWATDRLAETVPALGTLVPEVSGLLVARLSREQQGYIFWFRGEVLQTVKWAGDVRKTVTVGPLGDRLTPRKSFALWREEVRGRSLPWIRSEIAAADVIRHAYHELYAGQTQALIALNAEVAAARDQALHAMQAKDHFLAALSHELRTPLNPALLIASEEAQNVTLPEEVRTAFAAIRDNIELEARLIDDLLDLSRISHGKVTLAQKPVGLHAALTQALAILKPEFALKNVSLELALAPAEITVSADLVRLLQVFWNVLKNAIKFTPAGGSVTVSTRLDLARARALVAITDTGIGIRPDEIARIFDAFSQGDHAAKGSNHQFGGLGLGLAITRSLLIAHGGQIVVTSEGPGRGSCFTIELPVSLAVPSGSDESAQPTPPGVAKTGQAESRIRILLVEDHASTRAGMALVLERRGYQVSQAGTFMLALQLAGAIPFSLVISDIGLPDGDGYLLIREFRKLQPAMKAIALSGYGMDEDRTRALEAGFDELLVKPITTQSLVAAIERVRAATLGGRG